MSEQPMTPEEVADAWFEANPPPPLTDEQITALRSLFSVEPVTYKTKKESA